MGGYFYTDVECSPQPYHEAWQIWPGLAKPGLFMHFLSSLGAIARVCRDVSDEPFELPPVFNGCTELLTAEVRCPHEINSAPRTHFHPVTHLLILASTLTSEAELEARDLYWSVITNTRLAPGSPQAAEALQTLARVSELNPHVGEPHVVRAQLLLASGDVKEGLAAAEHGLAILCMWGTVWVSGVQHVGHQHEGHQHEGHQHEGSQHEGHQHVVVQHEGRQHEGHQAEAVAHPRLPSRRTSACRGKRGSRGLV